MKSLVIVFGAVILIIMIPILFDSIHDARVDDYTQNVAGVTTAAGVYSANVTLSQSLWGDSVSFVDSLSSNITPDSPTADSYNSVSGVLLVGGLDAGHLRTLSITYEIDSAVLSEHTGASTFLALFFWFVIFLIMGVVGGAIYAFLT